jgi:uncharacterized protein (TIGR02722 family)
MKSRPQRTSILLFRSMAVVAACTFLLASTPLQARKPKVKRVDASEQIDVSGEWNDTDSQLVADEMIEDCLQSAWLDLFGEGHPGQRPVVVVGQIGNKTHEHFPTDTFINELQRALINSGRVGFVADPGRRTEILDEIAHQQRHARLDTAKETGKAIGADFLLVGAVNSIVDKAGKHEVRYYQVDLELIELETQMKAWIGQKKLKKQITGKKARW